MQHLIKKSAIAVTALLVTLPSQAYLSLMTTGDIVPTGQFQLLGFLENSFDDIDYIKNRPPNSPDSDGLSLNGRASYGLNEDMQIDLEIGFGEFDYMIGGFLEWVPFPDADNQPAVGFRGGFVYVDTDNSSQTSITVMPFASKSFQSDHGKFVPYVGLPLALNSNDSENYFAARLAMGTEWTHPEYPLVHVIGEFDFELSKSFTSFSVGAAFDF